MTVQNYMVTSAQASAQESGGSLADAAREWIWLLYAMSSFSLGLAHGRHSVNVGMQSF